MAKNLKWGIVGLGKIAHHFVKDLMLVDGSFPIAGASRSKEKAETFCNEYDIPNVHGSYNSLFQDSEVDIVYIATPHDSHCRLSIEAMESGKHVLCEKPCGVNEVEVQAMVDCAKRNNVFFMEALWSRFNPAIQEALRIIESGTIGNVNYINADFAFKSNASEESRAFNMELAGGALLDVGIYPIFLSYLLKGVPSEISAHAIFHNTKADLQTAATLMYPDGFSQVMGGFNSTSEMRAHIHGDKGRIILDPRWHETEGFSLWVSEENKHFHIPKKGKGYTHEVEECVRCVEGGLIQSPKWSFENSLDLVRILDQIRGQIGLVYPFE